MHEIRLPFDELSGAERFVADVWLILTEFDLPTPRIVVKGHALSAVEICLTFATADELRTVRTHLPARYLSLNRTSRPRWAEGKAVVGRLDQFTRERVNDAVKRFNEALDEALANPSPNNIDELRKAGDELMRATGAVLIEIERLE